MNPMLKALGRLAYIAYSIAGEMEYNGARGHDRGYRERAEAGAQMVDDGRVMQDPTNPTGYFVTSEDDGDLIRTVYHVHPIGDPPSCTCHDFNRRKDRPAPVCKHIVAAAIMDALLTSWDDDPAETTPTLEDDVALLYGARA